MPVSCDLGLDLRFPCTSYLRKLEGLRLNSKENLQSSFVKGRERKISPRHLGVQVGLGLRRSFGKEPWT